jgi:hypothetical protein
MIASDLGADADVRTEKEKLARIAGFGEGIRGFHFEPFRGCIP